jgi:hypothetical protein
MYQVGDIMTYSRSLNARERLRERDSEPTVALSRLDATKAKPSQSSRIINEDQVCAVCSPCSNFLDPMPIRRMAFTTRRWRSHSRRQLSGESIMIQNTKIRLYKESINSVYYSRNEFSSMQVEITLILHGEPL